jgi:hypothetical protein
MVAGPRKAKMYLKVTRQRYAKKKMKMAPLVFPLTAVPITLIMTTPRGSGMNPIRLETMSEWSEKACKDNIILVKTSLTFGQKVAK